MQSKVHNAAFAAVAIIAIGASVYAYRARDSAIRGWAVAADATSAAQKHATEKQTQAEELTRVRSERDQALKMLVRTRSGIHQDEEDAFAIASAITSHLYNTTLFGGKPWATTGRDGKRYLQTVNREVANMCATLSSTLIWALDLFDIDARNVNIAAEPFLAGDNIAPTHTFVEVDIDGSPMAFDPTFNAIYQCEMDGAALSARGILECSKLGQTVEPIYLSEPRPGRSLEEYPVAFADLLYAIEADDHDGFYHLSAPTDNWLESARKLYQ